MKLIRPARLPCNCHEKLEAFNQQWGPGRELGIGAVVECDCGKAYIRKEDQRDGLYWQQLVRGVVA